MKLVREHINEKFSEEGDALKDMGIIGDRVNFDEEAEKILKKYPNVKFNDFNQTDFARPLREWVDYTRSLCNKTIYGKFTSKSFKGEKYLKIKYTILTSIHFGGDDFKVIIYKTSSKNDTFHTIKNENYIIFNE